MVPSRICASALVATFVLGQSAQAQSQIRSAMKFPDPRAIRASVRAPHAGTLGASRGGLRLPAMNHAGSGCRDNDLREALLRGISETGVPTIETSWVPASKTIRIARRYQIARPALQCMFEPAHLSARTNPPRSFSDCGRRRDRRLWPPTRTKRREALLLVSVHRGGRIFASERRPPASLRAGDFLD